MKSTFEKMGGTYTLGADGIYYPNLVSTDEEPHYGKYGMMRKTYLKEHRPAMYSLYMLEDRLTEHLNTVADCLNIIFLEHHEYDQHRNDGNNCT